MSSLSQTVSVNVYNHAAGAFIGGTLTVPTVIVGYSSPVSSNALTVYNTAVGPAGALQTTGSTSLSHVTLNNVGNLAAGGSGSLSATLAPGQGVGAFTQSNLTLTFADASAYAGASGDLGTSTVTITGDVLDHASRFGLEHRHRAAAGACRLRRIDRRNQFGQCGQRRRGRANLMTLGATTSGDLSINNVSGIVPGDSAAIGATLASGQPVGAIDQTFNLTYADNGGLPVQAATWGAWQLR